MDQFPSGEWITFRAALAVGARRFLLDLKNFHGAESSWVHATCASLEARLRSLDASLATADAWHAAYSRPLKTDLSSGKLQTDASTRLKRAFPLLKDYERLALGSSYGEAFGAPSGSIHFRAGADTVEHWRPSSVVAEGTKLELLAACALRRIHQLLGRNSGPRLDQLIRLLESDQLVAPALVTDLNKRPGMSVGDFVLARGYFGQIVEERYSAYGYRALRVELLAERPLPQLAADWFRARDVMPLLSKEKILTGMREVLGNPGAQFDEASLRESALAAWETGLREHVRARS